MPFVLQRDGLLAWTLGTNPKLRDATWRGYKNHLSSLPAHYGSLASSILRIGCIRTLTYRCPLPMADKEGTAQTALSTLFQVYTGIRKMMKHNQGPRNVIVTPIKLQLSLSDRLLIHLFFSVLKIVLCFRSYQQDFLGWQKKLIYRPRQDEMHPIYYYNTYYCFQLALSTSQLRAKLTPLHMQCYLKCRYQKDDTDIDK